MRSRRLRAASRLVLAGVLLKVGVYGWLRFVVPVFPELLSQHADTFTTLVGLSSLLAAALAFGERDWHRRIALATCSSVGLSLIGVMTLTLEGLTGGVLRVLSHGLTAGLLVWLLPREELTQARRVSEGSSPANTRWRVVLVRFSLVAWIGLPGLSGFVAEFVTPFGLFQHAFNAAAAEPDDEWSDRVDVGACGSRATGLVADRLGQK